MKTEPRGDDLAPRAKPGGHLDGDADLAPPGKPPAVKRVALRVQPPPRPGPVRLSDTIRKRLGAVLLVIVILAVLLARWPFGSRHLILVSGYGGVLKETFFADEQITNILAERYGLKVELEPRGSIALACATPYGPDDDFVWLGDSVALGLYQSRGCDLIESTSIYRSPIVIYSWTPIVDALQTAGLVQNTNGVYTIDMSKLIARIEAGTTWASLGLPQLYGRVQLHTTDPNQSNSGYLCAGLIANVMNKGMVVDATTVQQLLPRLRAFFDQLGYMPVTSGSLFEQLMTMGMGAMPLVALYESQGLESVIALKNNNQQSQINQINQQLRILYPEPTVWADHPFAARTPEGQKLMDALRDPEIQRLAWADHGERPGVAGIGANPSLIPWNGIMPTILSVTPMPVVSVMEQILNAIAPSGGGASAAGGAATPPPPTNAAAVIPPTSTAAPRRARRRNGDSDPSTRLRRWSLHTGIRRARITQGDHRLALSHVRANRRRA